MDRGSRRAYVLKNEKINDHIYNYICIHIYSYCSYIKYPWKHISESIILVNEEEIRTGYFSLTYLKVKLKNTQKLDCMEEYLVSFSGNITEQILQKYIRSCTEKS